MPESFTPSIRPVLFCGALCQDPQMEHRYLSGQPPALAPVGPLWFQLVTSFVAVATLRRLASALQSTHLRLGDAAGMGTTHPSRALSTLAMKLCCSSLCCGQSLPMSDDFGVCFAELGIRRNTVLSIVLRQMAAT